jgi:hypothetical protein
MRIRKPAVGEYVRHIADGKVLVVSNHYAYLIGLRHLTDRDESYRIGPNELATLYEILPDFEPAEWDE